MKQITIGKNGTKAFLIGGICSLSYFVVYIVRNLLSAVTPQMIENGIFSADKIGNLSSVFFFTYAVGQLLNGLLGDRLKATFMISCGLLLAGISNLLFGFSTDHFYLSAVLYAAVGFFLSMLYAPMTRLIAENMPLKHATRCALSLSIASYFASPVAGILAAALVWQMVFHAGSGLLILCGTLSLFYFLFLKKKNFLSEAKSEEAKKESRGIRSLFEHRIVTFTLVSLLTGIIRTSVVFWMPTFFSQKLGFSPENAALIFTVSTSLVATNAFISVWIYKALKENMDLTLLLSFGASAVFFFLLFFVKNPIISIFFMILAVFFAHCAASMLWVIYCPGLADTGLVSSATGFLDFVSYMAAAIASGLFGNAVGTIGWDMLILIWAGLMLFGTLLFIPIKKKIK